MRQNARAFGDFFHSPLYSNPEVDGAHISAPSLGALKKFHSNFIGKVELGCNLTDSI